MEAIEDIRKEYRMSSLLEQDVADDPIQQFNRWWQDVVNSKIEEPNAMTLSTCNPEGKPSSRIVLLKGIERNGFLFFTNYDSRKGSEMKTNKFVSLVFFWKEIERQVRIEGEAEKISEEASNAYFNKRPRESRIGAWSSPQSTVIQNRAVLEKNIAGYEHKFSDENIPRPGNWGGYLVTPNVMEFWQGRPGRLHDRIKYFFDNEKNWKTVRLAP